MIFLKFIADWLQLAITIHLTWTQPYGDIVGFLILTPLFFVGYLIGRYIFIPIFANFLMWITNRPPRLDMSTRHDFIMSDGHEVTHIQDEGGHSWFFYDPPEDVNKHT